MSMFTEYLVSVNNFKKSICQIYTRSSIVTLLPKGYQIIEIEETHNYSQLHLSKLNSCLDSCRPVGQIVIYSLLISSLPNKYQDT